MAKRDSFLLRVDPLVLEAIRRWADDEMRSMNGQIEFILRSKLNEAGRLPSKPSSKPGSKPSSKPDKSNNDSPLSGDSHQETDSDSDSKSD